MGAGPAARGGADRRRRRGDGAAGGRGRDARRRRPGGRKRPSARPRTRRARLEQRLAAAEAALAEAQAAASDLNARRNALAAGLAEETRRHARFESECATVARERARIAGAPPATKPRCAPKPRRSRRSPRRSPTPKPARSPPKRRMREAREAEARSRGPLAEAERAAQRLDAEVSTLTKLLSATPSGKWRPAIDAVNVARGYEAALGAALGDDLQASVDAAAPAHWSLNEGEGDPELPQGVEPLAGRVEAPPALQRRLAQIGVVARADGARLAAELKAGQRLVSLRRRPVALGRFRFHRRSADAGGAAAGREEPARRSVARGRGGAPGRGAGARRGGQGPCGAAAKRPMPRASRAKARARRGPRSTRRATSSLRPSAGAPRRCRACRRSTKRSRAPRRRAAKRPSARREHEAALGDLAPSDELALALERARSHAAQERAEFAEAKAAAQASRARSGSARSAAAARSPRRTAPGPSAAPRRTRISPTSASGAPPPKRSWRRSPTRRPSSCDSADN